MPTLAPALLTEHDELALDNAAHVAGLDNDGRARLFAWAEQARAAGAMVDAVINGDVMPELDARGRLHVRTPSDPE